MYENRQKFRSVKVFEIKCLQIKSASDTVAVNLRHIAFAQGEKSAFNSEYSSVLCKSCPEMYAIIERAYK